MTTLKEIAETIAAYDKLVEKAKLICGRDDAEGWGIYTEPHTVTLHGQEAELSWTRAGYDGCEETESKTFDASLLALSLDGIKAWKAEERAKYEACQAREHEARERREAEAERREFERLKAKYEPATSSGSQS